MKDPETTSQGFAATLDFAISALRDLQQVDRLVGIISHVTELREWIDARLEVKAGAAVSVTYFFVLRIF